MERAAAALLERGLSGAEGVLQDNDGGPPLLSEELHVLRGFPAVDRPKRRQKDVQQGNRRVHAAESAEQGRNYELLVQNGEGLGLCGYFKVSEHAGRRNAQNI